MTNGRTPDIELESGVLATSDQAASGLGRRAIARESEAEWHPSYDELELLDLGDATPEVSSHVGGCSICRDVVQGFEAERARLLDGESGQAFLRRLRSEEARGRQVRGWWLPGFWGILAAAAAMAIGFVGLAPAPDASPEAAVSSPAIAPASLRSKGTQPLTVIRQRGTNQEFLHDAVPVSPGDRLRFLFYVDRRGPFVGGVLTDAGTWLPLFEGHFEPGRHRPSAATLRVTDEPGGGLILVGPPSAVARERATGEAVDGVQRARLEWSR